MLQSPIAGVRWPPKQSEEGKVLPVIDGLLAASALHHNLTVVSRNASDFEHSQVRVLNPWQA